MDNLKGVLGARRIDKMRNEVIRELCGAEKGVKERISESILRWFGHLERLDESRLVKRLYRGECVWKTNGVVDRRRSGLSQLSCAWKNGILVWMKQEY